MISGEIVEGERQAHIQFWYVLDAYTSALQATPNYVPTVLPYFRHRCVLEVESLHKGVDGCRRGIRHCPLAFS